MVSGQRCARLNSLLTVFLPAADFEYGADAAEVDRQNIAARLQRDVEEQSSRMHIFISNYLLSPRNVSNKDVPATQLELPSKHLLGVRGHNLSVTATAFTPDCHFLYTASKEGHIIKWDLTDGRMVRILGRRKPNMAANILLKSRSKASAGDSRSKTSGAARRRAMREVKEKSMQGISNGHANPESRGMDKGKAPAVESAMDTSDDVHSSSLFVPLEEGQGHTDEILALAVSPDGKYLVSGGRDKRIGVWSIPQDSGASSSSSKQAEKWLKGLGGHKDAITVLRFRQALSSPYELYSASLDRTIKLWAVDQLSYIETLFGHQDPVLDMDMLRDETAVSAGGRDRTVRFWKVRNESQLVLRGGGLGTYQAAKNSRDMLEGGDLLTEEAAAADLKGPTKFKLPTKIPGQAATGQEFYEGSIDCVAMIDETHFLSGGDSGAISLWATTKKKPIFTRLLAHGYDEFDSKNEDGETEQTIPQPRWITALACLPFGDVFASGSWDGHVRLWALDRQVRNFKPLYIIPAQGFVNTLSIITPPILSTKKAKEAAEKGVVAGHIHPALWRRRGGLEDLGRPGSEDHQGEEAQANGLANGHAHDSSEAKQSDSWAKVRIAKERVPPLLAIGVGAEHRLGGWVKMKGKDSEKAKKVRNGTIIVALPLRD